MTRAFLVAFFVVFFSIFSAAAQGRVGNIPTTPTGPVGGGGGAVVPQPNTPATQATKCPARTVNASGSFSAQKKTAAKVLAEMRKCCSEKEKRGVNESAVIDSGKTTTNFKCDAKVKNGAVKTSCADITGKSLPCGGDQTASIKPGTATDGSPAATPRPATPPTAPPTAAPKAPTVAPMPTAPGNSPSTYFSPMAAPTQPTNPATSPGAGPTAESGTGQSYQQTLNQEITGAMARAQKLNAQLSKGTGYVTSKLPITGSDNTLYAPRRALSPTGGFSTSRSNNTVNDTVFSGNGSFVEGVVQLLGSVIARQSPAPSFIPPGSSAEKLYYIAEGFNQGRVARFESVTVGTPVSIENMVFTERPLIPAMRDQKATTLFPARRNNEDTNQTQNMSTYTQTVTQFVETTTQIGRTLQSMITSLSDTAKQLTTLMQSFFRN